MYVRKYVSIYVCTYVCVMYVHMYVCMHTCMHVLYVCMYVSMYELLSSNAACSFVYCFPWPQHVQSLAITTVPSTVQTRISTFPNKNKRVRSLRNGGVTSHGASSVCELASRNCVNKLCQLITFHVLYVH